MITRIRKVLSSSLLPWVLLGILGGYLLITSRHATENDYPLGTPTTLETTSDLKVIPKNTKEDPDMLITQTYKVEINGETLEAPIVTQGPQGSTGVLKQTFDFTNIFQRYEKIAIEKAHKNWEVSSGIGVHKGDLYVPVGLQRNFKDNQAVEVEIHLGPSVTPKVTGGELKYKRLF